ncbi:MAG: Gfo/Idh/MocA family oxidoreductase [Lachnospiraceae bacterium]|nr:Gfo/Idh/MocA family oxidoreductase [Lachnospiraceae bacterium]
MNVLFIGLGSIAKRHIQNLKTLIDTGANITVLRSGNGKTLSEDIQGKIKCICTSKEELAASYDAVFVTNPTALHYGTLAQYLPLSDCFFIEKPVFVTGEEDISCFSNNKTFYVAAPLRYCNVIQWLRKNVDFSTVHSVRAISSSYLPDWRPGTDYRDTYSAHKDMGGGVSIDLIHEWDYISYLLGFPDRVHNMIAQKSNLEIDSDDIAVYIAEYADKLVEIHLDYFGRKTIRRLEIIAEDDTIIADLVTQCITWLSSGKVLDLSEDRDSYQKKELQHFLDIVDGKCASDNGIEEACRVLRIARGVE